MKRTAFVVALTLLVISLIIGFIFFFTETFQKKTINPINAIPRDVSLIVKVSDYHRFSENLQKNNKIWNSLKVFPSILKIDSLIRFLDTLSYENPTLNQLLSLNALYFSVHHVATNQNSFMVVATIPNSVRKNLLIDFFSKSKRKQVFVQENKFNGTTIYSLKSQSKKHYYLAIAIKGNLIICSNNNLLVESSLKQIDNNTSLVSDPNFLPVYQTIGSNVDANLIMNNKNIFQLIDPFLKQTQHRTFFNSSNWTGLDINFKSDAVYFNGLSNISTEKKSALNTISRQTPQEILVPRILPSQTSAFFWIGLSNLNTYLEDYRSLLTQTGEIDDYSKKIGSITKNYNFDIHDFLNTVFNKELALAFVPFDGIEPTRCWFTVIQVNSRSHTEQLIENYLSTYVDDNKQSINKYIFSIKIDKETPIKIYRMPFKSINRCLFGELFSSSEDEYLTLIDDYMIFGDSIDVLNKFFLSNIHNNQLNVDLSYSPIKEALASSSNSLFYINPSRSNKLFKLLLDSSYYINLNQHFTSIEKLQGLAMQLTANNQMIFSNIHIKYSNLTSEDPQSDWESRLDTVIIGKPQICINHYTKNKEIFVQDVKYNIYLLNDVGRILWKKRIAEPIIGDVTQVDLFKNGKLQFVFNTKNNIYIIDRNGKNVEGFPIKLKASATNPVAIFDYEQTHDYRFFIAGNDNRIYAFNNAGKPLVGWTFKKTEKTINEKLQHFRIKGIDYIVFADANRVYILDRKGKEKVRYSQFFSKSSLGQFVLEEKNNLKTARLVATDSLGIVHYLYFDGRFEKNPIKSFSSNHYFDFQDVDADGEKDFIYIDNSNLSVFKQNRDQIFSYNFDFPLFPKVIYFNFGASNRKIGVATINDEVFLINSNGSLYNGFPLKGKGLFSITKFKENQEFFNLIVGSSKGSVLNYEVK